MTATATSSYSSTSYLPSYPLLEHTPTNSVLCRMNPAYERVFSDCMYGSAFGFLLDATPTATAGLQKERSDVARGQVQVQVQPQVKQVEVQLPQKQLGQQLSKHDLAQASATRPPSTRRSSILSEKSACRVLPPQRPIPSHPLPAVPVSASASPSGHATRPPSLGSDTAIAKLHAYASTHSHAATVGSVSGPGFAESTEVEVEEVDVTLSPLHTPNALRFDAYEGTRPSVVSMAPLGCVSARAVKHGVGRGGDEGLWLAEASVFS